MLELLRRYPDFRRLWLSDAISLFGDWLTYVAISALVVEQHSGWLGIATVLVVHTLPATLASPGIGKLSDRFDRRRLLIASALARGAITIGMFGLAWVGELGGVQMLLALRMALAATEHTTTLGALRRVVPRESLGLANAATSATWSVMFTLGVAAGGGLAAWLGPVAAIGVDAASFLIAALVLRGLPAMPPRRDGNSATGDETRPVPDAPMLPVLRLVLGDLRLRRLTLGKTPLAIAGGGAWVYLNYAAGRLPSLGQAALAIGALQCARAVGTGVGPWLHRIATGGSWEGLSPRLVVLGTFASLLAFAECQGLPLLLTFALVWGLGVGANWVLTTAGMLSEARDEITGRVSAIDMVGMSLGMSAGALLGAAAAALSGEVRAVVWAPMSLAALTWLLIDRPWTAVTPSASPSPNLDP